MTSQGGLRTGPRLSAVGNVTADDGGFKSVEKGSFTKVSAKRLPFPSKSPSSGNRKDPLRMARETQGRLGDRRRTEEELNYTDQRYQQKSQFHQQDRTPNSTDAGSKRKQITGILRPSKIKPQVVPTLTNSDRTAAQQFSDPIDLCDSDEVTVNADDDPDTSSNMVVNPRKRTDVSGTLESTVVDVNNATKQVRTGEERDTQRLREHVARMSSAERPKPPRYSHISSQKEGENLDKDKSASVVDSPRDESDESQNQFHHHAQDLQEYRSPKKRGKTYGKSDRTSSDWRAIDFTVPALKKAITMVPPRSEEKASRLEHNSDNGHASSQEDDESRFSDAPIDNSFELLSKVRDVENVPLKIQDLPEKKNPEPELTAISSSRGWNFTLLKVNGQKSKWVSNNRSFSNEMSCLCCCLNCISSCANPCA
jgi:hypothetical protein